MENMKLTFVNVGYGEAILLECPARDLPGGVFTMLIDGGSAESEEYADRSTGRIPLAEYLKRRNLTRLDLMVSTHIHEDHLCGLLPVAEWLPPAVLWQPLSVTAYHGMCPLDETLAENASQRKFLRALSDYETLCRQVETTGGELRTVLRGETLEPCPGLRIRVLAPGAAQADELEALCAALYQPQSAETLKKRLLALDARMNNFSLILLVEYRGSRILLPGDTNCLGYEGLEKDDLRADLFKMGHHGQKDSVTEELLRSIRPKAAVCCASSDRRYNSADPMVLAQMQIGGVKLYFSDCPEVPGITESLQAHQALEFTVGENGALDARYCEE